jgi:hypothetical protein
VRYYDLDLLRFRCRHHGERLADEPKARRDATRSVARARFHGVWHACRREQN